MNNKLLEIGSTITIERSDGRIHMATVSKIDYNMKTVDVEWLEENLTRGKQLYFQTVLELNPTVKILNINNSCTELTILNKGKKSKIKLPQSSRLSETQSTQNTTRSLIGKIENERMKRRQRQAECKKDKLEITKKIMNNPYYEWEQMIYEYWKNLKRQPLRDNDNVANDHVITVCVRKRPLNKIELLKKEIDIITITTKNQLILHEPKTKIDLTKFLNHQLFKFDLVFDENCTNDCIYKFTAKPLIENIFKGGYSTCFAYGQTGSGKTYTIFGDNKNKQQQHHQQQQGIYTLIIKDIFKSINSNEYRALNLLISCSFFEIYSRKILDLFNNKQELKILEDNKQQIQIIGLTEKFINKIDDLFKLIENGNNLRTSGSTKANKNSSRSHAILQISLKRFVNNKFVLYGKFSLIDLAGNERGTNTMNTTKVTHMESAEINKSLLALKECIRALERKDGAHLPFRLSKLTQILRDSFIGHNTRTCMIATVAPNINSCDDSLNTLRYADRVKELSNDNDHNDDNEDDQEMMTIDDDKEEDESSDLIFVRQNHEEIVKKLQETYERIKDFSELSDTNLNAYCENLQLIIDRTIEFLLNSKSSLMKFNRN